MEKESGGLEVWRSGGLVLTKIGYNNFMFRRKCKVTFIAHGATINSEENRLCDDESHPPISAEGRVEIEKISKWLKAKGLKTDKIYACSALRCVQSARIISEILDCPYETTDELRSRKAGLWSGLTFSQIEEKYPKELEKYHLDRKDFWVKDGESTQKLNERVSLAINKIVEENLGKRIIIVTHPEIIQTAVALALSVPVENQFKIYAPTGSATQISYYIGWSSLVYSAYLPL